MTTIRKLHNHPYANCKVIETEYHDKETNKVIRRWVLRSYTTDVVLVRETPTQWELTCYGTYSQTTRRQIGWFLDDIGSPFTFNDAKCSVETGRIAKGYKPGAMFCLVHNGVTYNPADLQTVIDFASYRGFSDYTVIDAATGELVYEQ